MRLKRLALVVLLAAALAVPTAAVTTGQEEVADAVSISPHEGPNGRYATIEEGELHVDFGRLNDEARTLFHDVFTVAATADRPVRVWVEVDTPGDVSAYEGDDPDAEIAGRQDAKKLRPGERLDVGFAVDTRGETPENGTVTIGVLVPETGSADIAVTDARTLANGTVVGTPVGVEATVVNRGNAAGNRTLNLTVDGAVVATETVFVPANTTETVRFDHAFDAPGNYSVGVSGTSAGTVRVRPAGRAVVTVTGASVAATEVPAGGRTTVTATVRNVGDRAGTGTVELAVDGAVVANRTVTLGPGERRQLTFERAFPDPGSYRVTVGGRAAGTVTVVAGPSGGGSGGGGSGGGGSGGGGAGDPTDEGPAVSVLFDGSAGAQPEVSVTALDALPEDDPSWNTTAIIDPARVLGVSDDGLAVHGRALVTRPEETVTLTGSRSYVSAVRGIATEPRTAAIVDITPPADLEDTPATIRFRVDRSAFPETDATRARIGRRTPAGWQLLPTEVVETTSGTVVLEARSFGFSTFTVFAVSDVTYEWTLPNGTTVPRDQLRTAFDEPGRYGVTLTVTDAFGRSDVAEQEILVNDPPTVTVEGVENASTDGETTLQANVTNEVGNATVTWTFGDGSTVTGREVTRRVAPGETVHVTVEDEFGAVGRTSVTIPAASTGRSGSGGGAAGTATLPTGVPAEVLVGVVGLAVVGAVVVVRSPVEIRGSLPVGALRQVVTSRSPRVTALENPRWDPEGGWLTIGTLGVESPGSLLDTVEVRVTDDDGREVVRASIDVAGRESYRARPERIRVPNGVAVDPEETYELSVHVVDERERMGTRELTDEELFGTRAERA